MEAIVEEIDFTCTIDGAGLGRRADQFDSLVPQVLARRRGRLTLSLELRAEAAQDVGDFVAEESRCCPFFSFDVDEIDRGVRLVISTPAGGEAMLEAIAAGFAGERSMRRARFERAAGDARWREPADTSDADRVDGESGQIDAILAEGRGQVRREKEPRDVGSISPSPPT